MHIEVQVALNFVISYLYNKLPRRRVNIFGEELEKALKEKFRGHWYPDKPMKGSAFRCLKTGDPVDTVFEKAARESGVPIQDILENLPAELAVWVDPGEVSYRIGEKGTIKILYNEQTDVHEDRETDREVIKTFNPEAQCFRPIDAVLGALSLSPKGSPPLPPDVSPTGGFKGPGSPSPVAPSAAFLPRSTAPLTFTTATFAQTKFGSTKLKTNSKRATECRLLSSPTTSSRGRCSSRPAVTELAVLQDGPSHPRSTPRTSCTLLTSGPPSSTTTIQREPSSTRSCPTWSPPSTTPWLPTLRRTLSSRKAPTTSSSSFLTPCPTSTATRPTISTCLSPTKRDGWPFYATSAELQSCRSTLQLSLNSSKLPLSHDKHSFCKITFLRNDALQEQLPQYCYYFHKKSHLITQSRSEQFISLSGYLCSVLQDITLLRINSPSSICTTLQLSTIRSICPNASFIDPGYGLI